MPGTRTFSSTQPVSLALQGGGAHGAFTWGVLERLSEEPGFRVAAISATSSGAMNACAFAQGWARGGAAGAREALAAFWEAVSCHNAVADFWLAAARNWRLDAFLLNASPLQINPLRGLVESAFDMNLLRRSPLRLHIPATRVRDGALTVFDNAALSHDALLASACLPQWFPTVEIDGEAYWDGGYAGNPALEPLLQPDGPRDILAVLLQPEQRSVPQSARDIAERINQLSFGSVFLRELRSLSCADRPSVWARLHGALRPQSRFRLQRIHPAEEFTASDGNAASDTRLGHLQELRGHGRTAAEAWLHGDRAAVDLALPQPLLAT